MKINLFVKYEDIEKYERGEVISAYDAGSKRALLSPKDHVMAVSIESTEVFAFEDIVTRGMVKGTFQVYKVLRNRG